MESEWDCTLEALDNNRDFAVRVGLRYVKGIGLADFDRIEVARRETPFASVEDLADRTGLDQAILSTLAEAGAMEELTSPRRGALWQALGTARARRGPLRMSERESPVDFQELSAFQTVQWDYRTQGHSARSHPLAAVREELRASKLPTAKEIASGQDGQQVRYVGLVICRQRPGTAKGVVFLTMEDETGFVNVLVWRHIYARYRVLVRTTPLLGVTGTLQVEGKVVYIVARMLWKPDVGLQGAHGPSRDFH
jgi:error-prone DNA polymerase